jgi:hypothetical protein
MILLLYVVFFIDLRERFFRNRHHDVRFFFKGHIEKIPVCSPHGLPCASLYRHWFDKKNNSGATLHASMPAFKNQKNEKSRRRELNPRPADYESAAMPLSHGGALPHNINPYRNKTGGFTSTRAAWSRSLTPSDLRAAGRSRRTLIHNH